MNQTFINLEEGKKIYFASDFHLGTPDQQSSRKREEKIVRWLNSIQDDAAGILLVGDLFDFWFEYKHTIPKGYRRFLAKISQLRDLGIPIIFFTGNHDLWMFDYFPSEYGIPVYKNPEKFQIGDKVFFIGHGDGLGPGDRFYKFVKVFFTNSFCQWCFKWLHPNIGMAMANYWSRSSRHSNDMKEDEFKGENESLFIYCREIEANTHHDFYVFGHRHLPLEMDINQSSKYINLGEWVLKPTFAEFDGKRLILKKFEG